MKKDKRLPAEIHDIPIDVRQATAMQCLRDWWPEDFKLAMVHGRTEQKDPQWKMERNVQTGRLVPPPPVMNQKATPKLASVKTSKQQVTYTGAGIPLSKFTGKVTMIAYASPDDGFFVLRDYLTQTKSDLNIAMYDFTSGELLDTVTKIVRPGKVNFQMVLDHPPRNPTANQTDDVTVKDLKTADPKANINWALTRNDPVVDEWIYPTAYHIKVVVRDKKDLWLSSGNFNVSNQPDLKANTPSKGSLTNADRDWHVIILNGNLAKLYGAFIDHDAKIAAQGQGTGNVAQHKAIHQAMSNLKKMTVKQKLPVAAHAAKHPFVLGKNKTFTNVQVAIQPLLTPDQVGGKTMYVANVLKLIQSATRSVYMQTQYVHPSDKPGDKEFMQLVQALSDAHKKGLDVRLITSQFENTGQWMEKLKPFNLDQVLRIQQSVHNKGIVVDSKVVMVSSQNWSTDGCLRNRDAGLIIENEEVAKYFEAIFLDDWVNRAEEKIGTPATKRAKAK